MFTEKKHISELYQFNLKRLSIVLISAFILVGSWCVCGTQCCTFKHDSSLKISLWNRIDASAFRIFNQWLLKHDKTTLISKFFVLINSIVIGELISNITILLVTYWIFSSKYIFQNRTGLFKFSVLLIMIIYGMAGQMLLSKLSRDFLCPKRPSPSVVFRFSAIQLEDQALSSSSDPFIIERVFEEAKKRDLVKEVAYDR